MTTGKAKLVIIDPSSLPAHFDGPNAEERWGRAWSQSAVYHYDASRPKEETFIVDTPPPTVSGSLHVGHVFSFTHTDVIVRYQRMRGRNIFYPMGWDDNGLPTERRVQNYFHVRCDPHVQYQPGLTLPEATDKQRKERPQVVSRQNFIEMCLELTAQDEKAFKALWQRIALSVDWHLEYSTIDTLSRTMAQLSFLDLFYKGHVYNVDAPAMWDVDFQTAVAQAEVEDRPLQGFFYHLRFGVADSEDSFVIATTRPELLPACVGVAAHPDDERFKPLFGRRAVTPLFRAPVPIFPSELVDPEKGTGILMVCTFGDATDVIWWREQKFPLRQVLGRDGRLMPVTFGSGEWESLDPASANHFYEELAGKTTKAARKIISDLLREGAAAATGSLAPLVEEPKPIEHSVKFFEKGDRPLEFIPAPQWFVRLLDKKDRLIELGESVSWHPDFMRTRYRNWTENLQFDWCISRQRYFGVAFPLWYPVDEAGAPDLTRPILATPDMLPVDPMQTPAPGFDESQRGQPGGFTGEADVFDTWFTSSMSPQIGSHWQLDPERHSKLFPSDVRPQSHEIIRTWAFYTLAKAMLHEGVIPWKHALISGWILDPDHKKVSKSKGNAPTKGKDMTPARVIDDYGADAVRYWSSSARLGTDTMFDENVMKIGRRLVTKIFNASKFVLSQSGDPRPVSRDLDRAFLMRLKSLADRATEGFDSFEFAVVLGEIEKFFWNDFTDTFLELVKLRARSDTDEDGRGSALVSLRLGLSVLLRLFAPFLPYITEEVWSWAFAQETGLVSIHQAPWPGAADFKEVNLPESDRVFSASVACWSTINRRKSESGVSIGRAIEYLRIGANASTLAILGRAQTDVMAAARAIEYELAENSAIAEAEFEVQEARFAEKEAK